MSPQTCTDCGSELAPGQRFCPGCGTPVPAAPTEAVAVPPPLKKTPRRGLRLLLVGGGGLVLLACICMAVFVVGSLLSDTAVAPLATPRRDYEAGEYFIELIEQTNDARWSAYSQQTFSDFAAEIQVRFETDVESVRGGLVWRMQDGDNYYRFTIRSTGQYILEKFVDGEMQTLIPATASPHINTGVATNNLKVVAAADLISIYVNDQHLADFTDSSFSEGKIGLRAGVRTESPITTRVFFDNLRIYAPTAPSTVLFEDDFDDPESGWAVAEAETYRVGYVSASEAVEASEPVEIVSERELTTEEFFQAVEGDESFADVYALAAEQGYTEQGMAAEVILSNATVLSGLALGSPQDEAIIAIQAASGEGNSSMLLRYENETIVLYDREGRLELTEQGIAVFDSAGDPIGEMELTESWRPPALASALQQQECDTGPMHEIKTCFGGKLKVGAYAGACVVAVGAAIKACPLSFTPAAPAAGPVCAFALLAATSSCVFSADCIFYSGDDPPTLTATMCKEAQTPPTLDCEYRDGREVVVEHQDYVCGVVVKDDREPLPPGGPYREATVLCDFGHTVEVADCGGNTAELTLLAPPCQVVAYCDSGVCEEGRCLAPPTPVPPTSVPATAVPPEPPGPTGAPVITISLTELAGGCTKLEWDVQNATTVTLGGVPVDAVGEMNLCPEDIGTFGYTFVAEGPGGIDIVSVPLLH
ncbi:MAG TPA: zinc-ribbon domain-containing protein [Anaerolineae bacterium]|nr:zinc-ribbon domain-containing protein [Anaerolineae bacterium]